MTQGYVSSSIFWDLANYLKDDVNYIAWYPMFNILSFMWPVWDHPEAELMKGHVRQMLGGLLEHLGYEERDGEDNMQKTLRLLATRWACKLGHIKCQRVAAGKLSRHLSDRNNENIFQPWWKDWVYSAGMILANETISQILLEKYEITKDIDMLKYLFCSDDVQIIIKYTNEISSLTMKVVLLHKDEIGLHLLIIKKHIRNPDLLEYYIRNYFKINL
ncbi:uncharacterized protein LOC112589082 [Harpegnathos saltator]|uniref:uncharacterized protein LOC112589082 n=1 Tax=Harpegnathos saltator TaxID=610380 RepID=UPI000DBEF1AA|nr:uncharacterized protein LOC112589082 [Harpegnathos saltator]